MKYTFLLDAGHGGLINNKYVTPGKRSPIWKDGTQLFEGVFNRELVAEIKKLATAEGIKCLDVVDSQQDVSLKDRVTRANAAYKINKACVYISVHGDAAGNGVDEHPATGVSVFTTPGYTNSDKLAEIMFKEIQKQLGTEVKMRTELSDKDSDFEAKFYVLTETAMPAILVENGFMTNFAECTRMNTAAYKQKLARAYVNAMKIWETTN